MLSAEFDLVEDAGAEGFAEGWEIVFKDGGHVS